VQKDAITCLECGASMKLLKRHLTAEHGMTPDAYRARWDLDADYPLVAPSYAERRKELAVEMGLGKAPNQKRGRRPKS
jgi:predicted transcriptional regulator